MGQHKTTALAARDWDLFLTDALDDLLDSWFDADPAEMAAQGASSADRDIARQTYADLCQEWDGTAPEEDAADRFASRYDAAIRAAGERRMAPEEAA